MMISKTRVVVARHLRRRGAAAQAWAALSDALRDSSRPTADIHTAPAQSRRRPTHPDTLSATLDALLAVGVEQIRVIGDAHHFARLRYADETWDRPVRLIDRNLATTTHAPDHDSCAVVILAVAGGVTATEILNGNATPSGPRLCLVDGFDRRKPFLVAGTDPVAVDATATRLLGRDPRRSEPLARAAAEGWGTLDDASIDVHPILEILSHTRRSLSTPHTSTRPRRVRTP